jgi:hypothetical protein
MLYAADSEAFLVTRGQAAGIRASLFGRRLIVASWEVVARVCIREQFHDDIRVLTRPVKLTKSKRRVGVQESWPFQRTKTSTPY